MPNRSSKHMLKFQVNISSTSPKFIFIKTLTTVHWKNCKMDALNWNRAILSIRRC